MRARSLAELMNQDQPPRAAPVSMDVERVRLADAFTTYHRVNVLEPGDLVRAKPGLQVVSGGCRPPTGIFVVMAVKKDAPERWGENVDLHEYGCRFDTQLGFYDEDGDFLFVWTDARRYEPLPIEDAS